MSDDTLNILIGLSFVVAAPLFLVWAIASAVLWWQKHPRVGLRNYRLAVTAFLVATTVAVADFARLRFHRDIGPIEADSTTWLVFGIRWTWVATIAWATFVLTYGGTLRQGWRWICRRMSLRRKRPPPEPEPALVAPFLEEDEALQEIRRQARAARAIAAALEHVLARYDAIIDRVDRDEPIALANRRRHVQ